VRAGAGQTGEARRPSVRASQIWCAEISLLPDDLGRAFSWRVPSRDLSFHVRQPGGHAGVQAGGQTRDRRVADRPRPRGSPIVWPTPPTGARRVRACVRASSCSSPRRQGRPGGGAEGQRQRRRRRRGKICVGRWRPAAGGPPSVRGCVANQRADVLTPRLLPAGREEKMGERFGRWLPSSMRGAHQWTHFTVDAVKRRLAYYCIVARMGRDRFRPEKLPPHCHRGDVFFFPFQACHPRLC